jgi:hypothetical protein
MVWDMMREGGTCSRLTMKGAAYAEVCSILLPLLAHHALGGKEESEKGQGPEQDAPVRRACGLSVSQAI